MKQDNQTSNQNSEQILQQKLKLDFYKLHYPQHKSPKGTNNVKNKMRSKSVVEQLNSPIYSSEQLNAYQGVKPKGSIRKQIANRNIEHPKSLFDSARPKGIKLILSTQKTIQSHSSINFNDLQISNYRDIQQLARKHPALKQSIQKTKDQKIKLNRIVLSHKQSEEIKLEYLQNKKEEMGNTINAEIRSIYEQYYKDEYEGYYGGVSLAEEKFHQKMGMLLGAMTDRIYLR